MSHAAQLGKSTIYSAKGGCGGWMKRWSMRSRPENAGPAEPTKTYDAAAHVALGFQVLSEHFKFEPLLFGRGEFGL